MSTKEQALKALYTVISTSLSAPDRLIERNTPEELSIPENGLIIMFDGDQGEPESVTLSPVAYAYEHIVNVYVSVQNRLQSFRDDLTDSILEQIENIVLTNRTLTGTVDYCQTMSTESNTENVDGIIVKHITVPIMIRYVTSNPNS